MPAPALLKFSIFALFLAKVIMIMKPIPESELILKPDGSIYHLSLKPEDISDNIIIVGDPARVPEVSKHFSKTELKVHNREINTHTGIYKGKRITVLSSGMGVDNIDIVINELDALANIDLKKRIPKETHTSLNLIRLGTSGALQPDIPVDSFALSRYGLGLDGILYYYRDYEKVIDHELTGAFISQMQWNHKLPTPYIVKGSSVLENKFSDGTIKGITATAPGFYGPQGREIRLRSYPEDLPGQLGTFRYQEHRIINFEMETSALFGLSKLLGHEALSICAIIANRQARKFSENHHKTVEELIVYVLDRI